MPSGSRLPGTLRTGRSISVDKGLFVFSFICLIGGIGAFAAGSILQDVRKEREVRKGHTTAKVVDLSVKESKAGSGGQFHHRFYPVFQYYAEGHLYETIYPKGSYPSLWKKGQEVRIDYDLSDPTDYCLSSRDLNAFLPMILTGCGAALVLIGALLFIRFAMR